MSQKVGHELNYLDLQKPKFKLCCAEDLEAANPAEVNLGQILELIN